MKKPIIIGLLLTAFSGFAQKDMAGTFKTDVTVKKELAYALHIPEDVKSKKPLIVFLHGSGEKGTNTELVKVHGPFKYLKTHSLDAYVLAPQCRENEYWENESLYRLITKIVRENNIDPDRIYLTGLSLGGWGTYRLGIAHPEMFAALVPICGFVDKLDMGGICKIKDIPIRIFHGVMDDVVNPQFAMDAYKELKKCNAADVELTLFDDADHNSWTRVYDFPEVYQWMLGQNKTNQTKNAK